MTNKDQSVLEKLLELGSNMTKPHQIDFFLYFPTKETARLAAKVIEKDGFEVDIQPGEKGEQWLCLAMKKMVPEYKELTKISDSPPILVEKYPTLWLIQPGILLRLDTEHRQGLVRQLTDAYAT